MLEERNRLSSPNKHAEQSLNFVGSANHYNEIDAQPNEEERIDTELTVMSSDSEQLLTSNDCAHKRTLTWTYAKYFIKSNTTKYRNWFLILFKNGYWRSTIILW